MAGGSLSVGRSPVGYCLRLIGRCTMAQSPAAQRFVDGAMRDGGGDAGVGAIHVDVSECTYLDSTFLGALLAMHRTYGKSQPPRLTVVAAPAARAKLFEATHLHKVFHFAAECPGPIDAWVDLPCGESPAPQDLARHVAECHRRLAEVDGPNQRAFAMIADKLESELGAGKS